MVRSRHDAARTDARTDAARETTAATFAAGGAAPPDAATAPRVGVLMALAALPAIVALAASYPVAALVALAAVAGAGTQRTYDARRETDRDRATRTPATGTAAGE
ncbi:hypothetical protein [Haloparvum sedimenti]|uniref:hypothetical protein n=1 Tax=Haloparvum sedimenti TaxID=1678448 RepID=UPI00071E7010|nr:hypothetical protein [Haloparvum sedimenti]